MPIFLEFSQFANEASALKNLQHGIPFFHSGQSQVEPLIGRGQFAMVEAQRPQNRRVQVVHMNRIFHNVVAKIVGRAVFIFARHKHFDRTINRLYENLMIVTSFYCRKFIFIYFNDCKFNDCKFILQSF